MGGSARAALSVSAARLRSQPLRPTLVVLGVALAFAMVAAVVGGSLVSYVSAAAASAQAPPIILIAPSVESVLHLPSLQPFYRVYSWLSPLRAEELQTWDIGRTLALESRGQSRLYDTDEAFRLSSP